MRQLIRREPSQRSVGFTLAELLVTLTIIVVVAGVFLPSLAKARDKARRISCVSHLKMVGLAFRVFASDNGGRFPMQVWTNETALPPAWARTAYFFGTMSNELVVPGILVCPADDRRPAAHWKSLMASNVSYFVGLRAAETWPQSLLAGDRNLTTNGVAVGPGLLPLSAGLAPGWTEGLHRRAGNVALGDGSVQQMTGLRLQEQAQHGGAYTNWLVVP